MAAARQRVHEIARELPREHDPRDHQRFDDETQARPADDHRLNMAFGATQLPNARGYGGYDDQPQAGLDVPYDALPSLETNRPFDRFEQEFEEHDPSTALRGHAHHGAMEESYEREQRQPQPSEDFGRRDRDADFGRPYDDENSAAYSEPPPAQATPYNRTAAYPPRDGEDSGPRQRPRKNAGAVPQYDAAAYEANYGRREGSIQRRERKQSGDEIRADYAPATARAEGGSYQPPPRSAPRVVDEYEAPKYEAQKYEAPKYEAQKYEAPKAHQSYQRERQSDPPAVRGGSYQPPPQQEPPRDNMKVPAGFVVGVQPIRTPGSGAPAAMPQNFSGASAIEAFPPPIHQHQLPQSPVRTPHMGIPPYGAQHPGTMAASPRAMHNAAPMHAPQMHGGGGMPMPHMHIRPATTNAPVGHQLQMTEVEEAQQGSKVGRFAWFVFGAAFGIFFAFFATGFVPRLGKKEEISFPNPPAIPTQQQAAPAVQPPPPPVQTVAAAPIAPPVAQQPAPPVQAPAPLAAAPTAAPPAFAPAPPPAAAPPSYGGVFASSQPASAPVAPAAAPAAKTNAPAFAAQPAPAPQPRGTRAGTIASRGSRTAPSPPPTPRNNSADRDDDAPAPTPKKSSGGNSGGGDIGDLLNAGLGN